MSIEAQVESSPPLGKKAWLSVIAVALAIFAVVSAEMLPIGLLTPIAHSLDQSVGHASLIISLPSLVAAITAPCVVLIFNQINRRKLFLLFMLLLLGSNLMAATVTELYWLLFARVLFGISMGGIWALAGSLAVRLAPPGHAGLATSIVFSGIAAASVLGVPLGVYLGDLFGWRLAFICVAALVGVVLVLLYWSLPSLAVNETNTLSSSLQLLKQRNVLIGLALTLLIVTGHFAAYTFIRPLLQSLAQFSDQYIGGLLLVYGLFGILGNFIAGYTIQKYLPQSLFCIAILLAISMALFVLFGHSQGMSIFLLLLWGVSYGGVSVAVMTWMFRAAPTQIETATAFNISIFNLSIGLGAYIGGVLYDSNGILSNLILACVLTAAAAMLIVFGLQAKSQH
ncbi:MFS transporter [Acinetobacter pullicarnis]|uniref:MFS transporter n=1 Tax=Acinetobacter pullicarnis TaxID=2576829 RepID=UPI00111F8773|nr:MFS transporter [Acinetobacter pullicarnis]